MNEESEQKWQEKLQDIANKTGFSVDTNHPKMDFVKTLDFYYQQFFTWFRGLSQTGQILVLLGVAIAILAVLKTVIQLVSLVLSLLLLAGLGIIGYRLLMSSKLVNKE